MPHRLAGRSHPGVKYLASILASFVFVVAPNAHADTEIVTHCVDWYAKKHGSGYCCSTCDDLPAQSYCTRFGVGGDFFNIYDQSELWVNQDVDGRDFTDSTQIAWGQDSNDDQGTDFADVIFYSGHGSWISSVNEVQLTMGQSNAGESCRPTISFDATLHAELGNGGSGEEADVFVSVSCYSGQYEAWSGGGFDLLSHASGQFNMLNGFHGVVWLESGTNTSLGQYAAAARYNGVGDAWLDYMYNGRGASPDNCPTSLGWGANSVETADYYNNAGWLDFHNNGSRSYYTIQYICGCNPDDGETLPTC